MNKVCKDEKNKISKYEEQKNFIKIKHKKIIYLWIMKCYFNFFSKLQVTVKVNQIELNFVRFELVLSKNISLLKRLSHINKGLFQLIELNVERVKG